MKTTSLALSIACLLMTAGLAHGQSKAPLPPPASQPPAGLPPLPSTPAAPPTSLPGTSGHELPPVPGQISDTVKMVDLTEKPRPDFDFNQYRDAMTAELVRLDQAIGSQMRVVGVEYGGPAHEMAIATAKQEKIGGLNPYVQQEIIPGGILASGQYDGIGSQYSQTCVVAIDPDRAAAAWEGYVLPAIQSGSHPQTGYAWMAGHAVGHCLDAQDRSNSFRSKLAWRPNEATALGLWPQAVIDGLSAGFGGTFAKDGFMNSSDRVYGQPTQRQFSERVADAFATLWIIRLGADAAGVRAIAQVRLDTTGDDAGVMAVSRGRLHDRAVQSPRADRLWDMAREAQIELGVDIARIPASRAELGSFAGGLNPEDTVQQWVVTPQGVMGVDAQGRIIQKPNTTQQTGQGRNFKDLRRFGQ